MDRRRWRLEFVRQRAQVNAAAEARSFAAHGLHWLVDCHGCDATQLADATLLEGLLREAAARAGATVLGSHFHRLPHGGGVTGVVMLAESHVTIHTWPEHRFAALDLFLCGATHPERAIALIEATLRPSRCVKAPHQRGTLAAVVTDP